MIPAGEPMVKPEFAAEGRLADYPGFGREARFHTMHGFERKLVQAKFELKPRAKWLKYSLRAGRSDGKIPVFAGGYLTL